MGDGCAIVFSLNRMAISEEILIEIMKMVGNDD